MKRPFFRAALTLHIMLFTASTVWAAEEKTFAGFKATGGTESTSYVGYGNQGYAKAVDGDRFSKWCTFHPTYVWYENSTVGGVFYVDFESAQPIIPTKYILTTGDDSNFWKGRNPVSWIVKGKLGKDDDWTILAKVVDDTRLPKQNSWDMTYDLDKVGKYKYFTFMVSKKVSPNESNMQLGEIRFVGYDNEYDMSTIIVSDLNTFSYNGGNAVSISGYTVKDLAGHVMVQGTDYTISYLKNGTAVSQVTAKGNYILRLTGKGSYTGVKEVAFRVVDGLQGNGSSSSPYLIHNVDEWNLFALSVNHGNNYSGKYVKLAGDVNGLTYPAGNTAETSFKGTFLGDNHTMTMALTNDGELTAPFRYVENATISGVCTAGTISTSCKFAAGLIGQTTGTVTISNCVSSVVISSSIDGDGTHGGLLALAGSGAVTFNNCMFKGAINGRLTKNCGGFVGWREGTLVLNDCKMAGTMSLTTFSGSATFSRNNGSSTTLNGCCYYITAYGDVQGLPMSTTATGKLERCVTAIDGCRYYVPATYSGLQANYVYSGSPVSPEPAVSCYGNSLTKGIDYTLSYANNNQMGTASVIVTGKGQYIGTTTLNYELVTTLTYRYYKDGTFHEGQKTADEFTILASSMTTLSSGWYAVTKDVTINDRIKVNGEVNIVLADGATFTANDGIEVLSRNTLKIYGQSTDEKVMGKLVASLKEETEECSTIGGSMSYHHQGTTTVYGRAGTIVIDGGYLNVTSSSCYAIGDGEVEYEVNDDERDYFETTTFNLTINGGVVYLGRGDYTGLYHGSIGSQADNATITINGGKITTENGINCRYKGYLSINDTGNPLELCSSINRFGGGSFTISGQFMLNDGTGTEAVVNHVNGYYYTTNFENKSIVNYRSVTLNDLESSATEKIPFGTVVSEPSRSSHPGYTFVGWATGDALYDFSAPVTSNLTITAKYRDVNPFGYTETYTPDGSENNPYIISTIDGWNAFCDALQDNLTWNRFIGQTVQMRNNIGSAEQPVIRMAGSSYHDFCGTFDGNNNKLIVSYGTADSPVSEEYVAPFRFVENGCTIRNLHVTGNIHSSAQYTSGLAGNHYGTVNITGCTVDVTINTSAKYASGMVGYSHSALNIADCVSSVTIKSSVKNTNDNDGTHGGFVAVQHNKVGAHITIDGSVFNGKMLTTAKNSTTRCGGFVGWRGNKNNENVTVSISNSLYAPATTGGDETEVKATESATFSRNGVNSITNCYYTRTLGTAQGLGYSFDSAPVNIGTSGTAYSTSGITPYTHGLLYDGRYYMTPESVTLAGNSTNDVASVDGYFATVTLSSRTLWKDGNWNTLCLPFDVILSGSPLAEAEARTLSSASMKNGTLMMDFSEPVTELTAGTPYLIRWDRSAGYVDDNEHNLVNPVFTGVTIYATMRDVDTSDGKVTFKGNYDYLSFTDEDRSVLFLGADNTLYYPDGQAPTNIGACRAYFQLNSGITVGDPTNPNSIRAFKLNFGEGDASSIDNGKLIIENEAGAWYTLNGLKLTQKPAAKGMYIHNGKKVVIK